MMQVDSEEEAWAILVPAGYPHRSGIIYGLTREATEAENAAIDYLCCEWDYGFQPVRYEDKDLITESRRC